MRVLVVTSYNNGAVAPFVTEQVDALRRAGVDCDYYLVQGKGLRGYLRNRAPLMDKIRSFQPDLVHAHYGLCGLLANLQRQVPVVTTFHGSDVNRRRLRTLSRLACRLSAHSLFVTELLRKKMGSRRSNSTVLPCGVDTKLFKPCDRQTARRQLLLPEEQPLVLFAGNYADPAKDVALARAALQHLPQVRLIEPRGYSREQMVLLFSAVDLLLLTSRSEGSPQVVKEALACNCPVVSVDVGDVRQRIAGIEGCAIAPRRPEAIANSIATVLLRQRCTEGRQRILSQQLDNDSVAQRLLCRYRNIVDNPEVGCIDLTQEQIPQEFTDQWDALYRHSTTATVFQSQDFLRFIETLDGWEPFALGVTESGVLKGVMVGIIQHEGGALRRFFSRRAIVNGGPLLAGDISDKAVSALLDSGARQLRRRAIYIETRNLNDYSQHTALFANRHYRYKPHYNFLLTLSDDFSDHYHRSVRRNLQTALRQPLQICHTATLDDVRQFYGLLRDCYTQRVHLPLPPLSFFEACHNSPLFHYTLVRDEADTIVAGTLTALTVGRTAHLWFAAGSRSAARQLYPSTVAYDATLRFCHEQEFTCFDFMGAGRPGDGGYGVRDFKKRFGGTQVEQGRFLRILHPIRYAIGCLAVGILRHGHFHSYSQDA